MQHFTLTETERTEHSLLASRPTFTARLRARLQLCWQSRRTRQQLAQLDARQLADAGISHAERGAELAKPFWR